MHSTSPLKDTDVPQVLEAVDTEYTTFLEERSRGITEILDLRKAVAEEEARKKNERDKEPEEGDKGGKLDEGDAEPPKSADVEMDVDDHDSTTLGTAESNKEAEEEMEKKEKEEPPIVPADGDDAVEY